MLKIFQHFNLNLEAITNSLKSSTPPQLPQASATLREKLTQKGYLVLESNDSISGAPLGIILGGDDTMNHKQDFYSLAQELRLPYSSGPFYTPHRP